jgi:Protein of unknown function (DUF760)
MDNITNHLSEFFEGDGSIATSENLWEYIQAMSPETMRQLSQPVSSEILQVMERNIIGMLGSLPAGQFDVVVTTSRENLSRLVASAMINGYFLRNAEQRLALEQFMDAAEENV